jgi:UDP-N-acetylmuramoylalanine--D-glutamate ligase
MASYSNAGSVSLCSLDVLKQALSRIEGKRVTVMGLGLFGGGEGAARFLAGAGAAVLVTDQRPAEKFGAVLERLAGLPITYRFGEHVVEDFLQTDLVVANPAVPRTSPFLLAAQQAAIPITSPLNIFLSLCPAPVAAVTGSNGKSTTTSLLALMVQSTGRKVWLGGNIGRCLLSVLDQIGPGDLVVLETSSFQLDDANALCWSPHVAVITNITANHLDRHGTFAAYAAAKRAILKQQGPQDFAVLNAHDATLRRWAEEGLSANVCFFDLEPDPGALLPGVSLISDRLVWWNRKRHEVLCCRENVPLLGLHNVANAMAAAAAARCLDARTEHIRNALSHFVGLEYRLELIGEYGGLRFYNDSYSTTPAAGIAALESLHGSLTLIAGGYDKKLDLRPLARAAARLVDVLITLGNTGPGLAQMVREESASLDRSVVIREVGSLQEAVEAVRQASMPGSAIVFSPSCPSYDMFDNYRHRGESFKALVAATFAGDMRRSRTA